MLKIKESDFLARTLTYLGAAGKENTGALEEEIRAAFTELNENADFHFCYEIYSLKQEEDQSYSIPELALQLPSEDLKSYFEGCDRVCVVACTLGIGFERYLKRAQKLSMSHSVVLDAGAGAYLELCCDATEEELDLGPRTYRFAPGYGDLPLELNIPLATALNIYKRIGVSHTGGGIFLPQKSMLGMIGLGRERKTKNCGSCIKKDSCSLRKEGTRCFQ